MPRLQRPWAADARTGSEAPILKHPISSRWNAATKPVRAGHGRSSVGRNVRRVIVTGANGAGKSHVATRLGQARPDVPVVSFDAIKLTRNWAQRPRPDIDAALAGILESDTWILEGGPSLLSQALSRAEAIIWLDPPRALRAWRLALRPWKHIGKTRPELPQGNADWPLQQYRFAIRSLRNDLRFSRTISDCLGQADTVRVWHCRHQKTIDDAVETWRHAKP